MLIHFIFDKLRNIIFETEQTTITYKQRDRWESYDKKHIITTDTIIKIAIKAIRNLLQWGQGQACQTQFKIITFFWHNRNVFKGCRAGAI